MKKHNPLTKHHRKPKSMKGGNHRENISIVPENKHAAYHLLFNEGRVDYIVRVLNSTWIDPEYEIFFRKKEVRNETDNSFHFDHIPHTNS